MIVVTQQTSQDQLWGTGPRRLYWWHLPVSPDQSASLGRDMIVALIVWIVLLLAFLAIIDVVLAATG